MFGLGLATKIYLAVEAVDMRKGFEGLYGLVRDQLGQDPLSGHLFLFTNRTKTPATGLWPSWAAIPSSLFMRVSYEGILSPAFRYPATRACPVPEWKFQLDPRY